VGYWCGGAANALGKSVVTERLLKHRYRKVGRCGQTQGPQFLDHLQNPVRPLRFLTSSHNAHALRKEIDDITLGKPNAAAGRPQ
jgi:hypothetical protein